MNYDFNENQNENEPKNNKKLINIIIVLVVIIIFGSLAMSNKNTPSNNGSRVVSGSNPGGNAIPEEVYNDTQRDDNLANVIFADKKVIYYAYFGECPQSKAFIENLKALMATNPDLAKKYYFYPDPQGNSTMVVCKKQGARECAQNYLFQRCGGDEVCIVNGPKKKLAIIRSKDASMVYAAIDKFQDW